MRSAPGPPAGEDGGVPDVDVKETVIMYYGAMPICKREVKGERKMMDENDSTSGQ